MYHKLFRIFPLGSFPGFLKKKKKSSVHPQVHFVL